MNRGRGTYLFFQFGGEVLDDGQEHFLRGAFGKRGGEDLLAVRGNGESGRATATAAASQTGNVPLKNRSREAGNEAVAIHVDGNFKNGSGFVCKEYVGPPVDGAPFGIKAPVGVIDLPFAGEGGKSSEQNVSGIVIAKFIGNKATVL